MEACLTCQPLHCFGFCWSWEVSAVMGKFHLRLRHDPHRNEISLIWRRQITDEAAFEIIYVAALRSVGVPARLDANGRAEFWDGGQWSAAPGPAVVSW